VTNQVEDFYNKLMLKKDGLEKTQAEVHRLLKDGHVTEKIRQKKRMTEELERHDADKLNDCELVDPPTLIHTGMLLIASVSKINKIDVMLAFQKQRNITMMFNSFKTENAMFCNITNTAVLN